MGTCCYDYEMTACAAWWSPALSLVLTPETWLYFGDTLISYNPEPTNWARGLFVVGMAYSKLAVGVYSGFDEPALCVELQRAYDEGCGIQAGARVSALQLRILCFQESAAGSV